MTKNLSSTRDQGEEKKILVEYVPPSAAMRPAWFGPAASMSGTSGEGVLREVEAEPIKYTKYAKAPLKENNF